MGPHAKLFEPPLHHFVLNLSKLENLYEVSNCESYLLLKLKVWVYQNLEMDWAWIKVDPFGPYCWYKTSSLCQYFCQKEIFRRNFWTKLGGFKLSGTGEIVSTEWPWARTTLFKIPKTSSIFTPAHGKLIKWKQQLLHRLCLAVK